MESDGAVLNLRCCLLSGGESRRMGRDKALLPHPDGSTWLERTLRLLAQLDAPITLLSRHPEHLEQAAALPILTIAEPPPWEGPLLALHRLMQRHPNELLLLCPVDMPDLNLLALLTLLAATNPTTGDAAAAERPTMLHLAHDGERLQPLLGLYPSSAPIRVHLAAAVERGERRFQSWLMQVPCRAVPLDPQAIRTVNGPEADQPAASPRAFTPRSQRPSSASSSASSCTGVPRRPASSAASACRSGGSAHHCGRAPPAPGAGRGGLRPAAAKRARRGEGAGPAPRTHRQRALHPASAGTHGSEASWDQQGSPFKREIRLPARAPQRSSQAPFRGCLQQQRFRCSRFSNRVSLGIKALAIGKCCSTLEASNFHSMHPNNPSPPSQAPEAIELIPGNSLITDTPEQGRQLAVKLSRLIMKLTQPDAAVRERLRPVYAEDAGMLIALGQTVAMEFATIAAANNYWKKEKASRWGR